jgi:hypothetical protein
MPPVEMLGMKPVYLTMHLVRLTFGFWSRR